jgi:hypothetical protein
MAISILQKKLIYISTLIGSIATIGAALTYGINKYNSYIDDRDSVLKEKVIKIIKEQDGDLITRMDKIDKRIDSLYIKIDSLDKELRNGSQYFSVGYRGDGSGQLWWRDEYGELFKLYNISGHYYYVKNGIAIYL